jgi:hypothetical protein
MRKRTCNGVIKKVEKVECIIFLEVSYEDGFQDMMSTSFVLRLTNLERSTW